MKSFGIAIVAISVLSGCGSSSKNQGQVKAPIGKIQIHGAVSQQNRDSLAAAFDYLDRTSPDLDENALQILERSENETPHDWLEERIHYIVSQQYNLKGNVFQARPYFAYQNPNVLPEVEKGNGEGVGATSKKTGKPQVTMSNIGAAIYEAGKTRQQLYGLRIEGIGNIMVPSPRTGVLQIGQGLFPKDVKESNSHSIFVLGVLFHEARHSDGNGRSAGFFHAVCPAGHDFAGLLACDRNTNGPYTVEATIEKELYTKCKTCSVHNLEILKIMYLDSFDRVIPGSVAWDSQPEGVL